MKKFKRLLIITILSIVFGFVSTIYPEIGPAAITDVQIDRFKKLTLSFEEFFPYSDLLNESLDVSASLISVSEDNIQTIVYSDLISSVPFNNNFFEIELGLNESNLFDSTVLDNPNLFLSIYLPGPDISATYNISSIPRVLIAKNVERVLRVNASTIVGEFQSTLNAGANNFKVNSNLSNALLLADQNKKKMGILKDDIQHELDVSGSISATSLFLNGVPFRESKSWLHHPVSQNNISYQGDVVVGAFQRTLYPLNVAAGTVNATALFLNGRSIFEASENWQRGLGNDVFYPGNEFRFAGIGTNLPEARLDVDGAIRVSASVALVPTTGILHFDNQFEGFVSTNTASGFTNLAGIKGFGDVNKFSLWTGSGLQKELTYQESLFLTEMPFENLSLLKLINLNRLDSSYIGKTLFRFFDPMVINTITSNAETTTINVTSGSDQEDIVVQRVSGTTDYIVNFNSNSNQFSVDDTTFSVRQDDLISLALNEVNPNTLFSIKPPNSAAHLLKVSSSNIPIFEINRNGSFGVSNPDRMQFALNVGATLNVGNLYRNGVSITLAYATGTYWLLNKIGDEENIFYDSGRVSIGAADPGITESQLNLMQTPGKGKQLNPLDNQDVGLIFSTKGGPEYIMGVDAGAVARNPDGSTKLDPNGREIVRQVFRVQKGVELNDQQPLFVAEGDRLGIGVNFPASNLHVSGNSGLQISGQYDFLTTANTDQINLGGPLFYFHPPRAAVRIGGLDPTFSPPLAKGNHVWASSNIGDFSVGIGESSFAKGNFSTLLGGFQNQMVGPYSTSWGGENLKTNGFFNFLAGRNIRTKNDFTDSDHFGTFVWSDRNNEVLTSANNQFLIYSTNGIGINTTDTSVGTAANPSVALFTLAGRKVVAVDFLDSVRTHLGSSATEASVFTLAGNIFQFLKTSALIVNNTVTKNISAINSLDLTSLGVPSLTTPVKDLLHRFKNIDGLQVFDRLGQQVNFKISNQGQIIIGTQNVQDAGVALLRGQMGVGIDRPSANLDIVKHQPSVNILAIRVTRNPVITPSMIMNEFGRIGIGGLKPATPKENEDEDDVPLIRAESIQATTFSFPDGSKLSGAIPVVFWQNDTIVKVSTQSIETALGYSTAEAGQLLNYLHSDSVFQTGYINKFTGIRRRNQVSNLDLSAQGINLSIPQAHEMTKTLMRKRITLSQREVTALNRFTHDLLAGLISTNSVFTGVTFDSFQLINALFISNFVTKVDDTCDHTTTATCEFVLSDKSTNTLFALNEQFNNDYTDIFNYFLTITVIDSDNPILGNIYFLENRVGINIRTPNSLLELSNFANPTLGQNPVIAIDPAHDDILSNGLNSNSEFLFGVNEESPNVFRFEQINATHELDDFGLSRSIFSIKEDFVGVNVPIPRTHLDVSGNALLHSQLVIATDNNFNATLATAILDAKKYFIGGEPVVKWRKSSQNVVFSTGLNIGIGGHATEKLLTVSGNFATSQSIESIPDIFTNFLTVNNIRMPATSMRGFETSGLTDDRFDLYVDRESLFLDDSSISNILSYAKSTNLLQEGFISYFPNKSLLSIDDIFHRPRVIRLSDMDIIAETPFQYASSFQQRNGANNPCYILNGGRGDLRCIAETTPVPAGAITKNIAATVTVNSLLSLDNSIASGNSNFTITRKLGVKKADVGMDLNASLTHSGSLRNSESFTLNEIDLRFNTESNDARFNFETDPGADVIYKAVGIDLNNITIGGRASTIFSENSVAIGLKSDVRDVDVQNIGGGSKGFKYPAIFKRGFVGIGTSRPSADLDVKGAVVARDFNITNRITIATLNMGENIDFIIGSERKFGLNTLSPETKLDIDGVISSNFAIAGGINAKHYQSINAPFIIKDGKVGIGTYSPNSQFELKKTFLGSIVPAASFTFQTISLNINNNPAPDINRNNIVGFQFNFSTSANQSRKANSNRFGGIDGSGATATGVKIDLKDIYLVTGNRLSGLDVKVSDNVFVSSVESEVEKAAVFMGGNVGIGTLRPQFALEVPNGTIKGIDFIGIENLGADQEGANISHLIVTPNTLLTGTDTASFNANVKMQNLFVDTISQEDFSISEFPFTTSTMNISSQFFASRILPVGGGALLKVDINDLNVRNLASFNSVSFNRLSVDTDLTDFAFNVGKGFLEDLQILNTLSAQQVSVNGSTLIVQSGKVGINTIPDSTLHIATSSIQAYNPADSRTWGFLLVSNNVNNLNTAVGVEFDVHSNAAKSGIAVVNQSVAVPASSMTLITGDLSGRSFERMRFHENGNISIGSTENQVERVFVNGDAQFQSLVVGDIVETSELANQSLIDIQTPELKMNTTFNVQNLGTEKKVLLKPVSQATLPLQDQILFVRDSDNGLGFSTLDRSGRRITGILSDRFPRVADQKKQLLSYTISNSLTQNATFTIVTANRGLNTFVTLEISTDNTLSNAQTFVITSNITNQYTSSTYSAIQNKARFFRRPNIAEQHEFIGYKINFNGQQPVGGDFAGGSNTQFKGVVVDVSDLRVTSNLFDGTPIEGQKIAATFFNNGTNSLTQSGGSVGIYTHSSYYDHQDNLPARPSTDLHIISSPNVIAGNPDDYNALVVSTLSTENVLVVSNNANVGVGTSNIVANLTVQSDQNQPALRILDNSGNNAFEIHPNQPIQFDVISSNILFAHTVSANNLVFRTGDRGMTITNLGTGINIQTPQAQLDILESFPDPEAFNDYILKQHVVSLNRAAGAVGDFDFNRPLTGLDVSFNTTRAFIGSLDGTGAEKIVKGLNIDLSAIKAEQNAIVQGLFVTVSDNIDQADLLRNSAVLLGGNVGINVSEPTTELDIDGDIAATEINVNSLLTNNRPATFNQGIVVQTIPLINTMNIVDDSKRLNVNETLTIGNSLNTSNLTLQSASQVLTANSVIARFSTMNRLLVDNVQNIPAATIVGVSGNAVIVGNLSMPTDNATVNVRTLRSLATMSLSTVNFSSTLNISNDLFVNQLLMDQIATPSHRSGLTRLFISNQDQDVYYILETPTGFVTQSITEAIVGTENSFVIFDSQRLPKSVQDLEMVNNEVQISFDSARETVVPVVQITNNISLTSPASGLTAVYGQKLEAKFDVRTNQTTDRFYGLDLKLNNAADPGNDNRNDIYTGLSVDMSGLITRSFLPNGQEVSGNKVAAVFLASPRDVDFESFQRASGNVGIFLGDENLALRSAQADLHIGSITENALIVSVNNIESIIISDNAYVGISDRTPSYPMTLAFVNNGVDRESLLKIDQANGTSLFSVEKRCTSFNSVTGVCTTPLFTTLFNGNVNSSTSNVSNIISANQLLSMSAGDRGIRILESGLVGINTRSPEAQLHLLEQFNRPVNLAEEFTFQTNTIDLTSPAAPAARFNFAQNMTALDIVLESESNQGFLGSLAGDVAAIARGVNLDLSSLRTSAIGDLIGLEVIISNNPSLDDGDLQTAAKFMGGNVGVGVLEPQEILDVAGTLNIRQDFIRRDRTDIIIGEGILETIEVTGNGSFIERMTMRTTTANFVTSNGLITAAVASINSRTNTSLLNVTTSANVAGIVSTNRLVVSSVSLPTLNITQLLSSGNITFGVGPSQPDLTVLFATTANVTGSMVAETQVVFHNQKVLAADDDVFNQYNQDLNQFEGQLLTAIQPVNNVGADLNWNESYNDNLVFIYQPVDAGASAATAVSLNITEQLKTGGFTSATAVNKRLVIISSNQDTFVDDTDTPIIDLATDASAVTFNIRSNRLAAETGPGFMIQSLLNATTDSSLTAGEAYSANKIKTTLSGLRNGTTASFIGLNLTANDPGLVGGGGAGNGNADTLFVGLAVSINSDIQLESSTDAPEREDREIIGRKMAASFKAGEYGHNVMSIFTVTVNNGIQETFGSANASLYVKGRDEIPLFRAQSNVTDNYYYGDELNPILILPNQETNDGQTHIFFGMNNYRAHDGDAKFSSISRSQLNDANNRRSPLGQRIIDILCVDFQNNPNCNTIGTIALNSNFSTNDPLYIDALYRSRDLLNEFVGGVRNAAYQEIPFQLNAQLNVLTPHKNNNTTVNSVLVNRTIDTAPVFAVNQIRDGAATSNFDAYFGFGTSVPGAAIEISQQSGTTPVFMINTPTQDIVVDATGKVGLGLRAPQASFHVELDLKSIPTRNVTINHETGLGEINSDKLLTGTEGKLYRIYEPETEASGAIPSFNIDETTATENIGFIEGIRNNTSPECNTLLIARLDDTAVSTANHFFDVTCSNTISSDVVPPIPPYGNRNFTLFEDKKPFIVETTTGKKGLVIEQNRRVAIGTELYPTQSLSDGTGDMDSVIPLDFDPYGGDVPTYNVTYESLRVSGSVLTGTYTDSHPLSFIFDAYEETDSEINFAATNDDSSIILQVDDDQNRLSFFSTNDEEGVAIKTPAALPALMLKNSATATNNIGLSTTDPTAMLHIAGQEGKPRLHVGYVSSNALANNDVLVVSQNDLIQVGYGKVAGVDTSSLTEGTVLDVRHPRITELSFVGVTYNIAAPAPSTINIAESRMIYKALRGDPSVLPNALETYYAANPIIDENGFLNRELINIYYLGERSAASDLIYRPAASTLFNTYFSSNIKSRFKTYPVGFDLINNENGQPMFRHHLFVINETGQILNKGGGNFNHDSDDDAKNLVKAIYDHFISIVETVVRVDSLEQYATIGNLEIDAKRGVVVTGNVTSPNKTAFQLTASLNRNLAEGEALSGKEITVTLETDYGQSGNINCVRDTDPCNKDLEINGIVLDFKNTTPNELLNGTAASTPKFIVGVSVNVEQIVTGDPIRIEDGLSPIPGKKIAALFLGGGVYMGGDDTNEANRIPTINGLLHVAVSSQNFSTPASGNIDHGGLARFEFGPKIDFLGIGSPAAGFLADTRQNLPSMNVDSRHVVFSIQSPQDKKLTVSDLNYSFLGGIKPTGASRRSAEQVSLGVWKRILALTYMTNKGNITMTPNMMNDTDGINSRFSQPGIGSNVRTAFIVPHFGPDGTNKHAQLYSDLTERLVYQLYEKAFYTNREGVITGNVGVSANWELNDDGDSTHFPLMTMRLEETAVEDVNSDGEYGIKTANVADGNGGGANEGFYDVDVTSQNSELRFGLGELVLFGPKVGINTPPFADYLLETDTFGRPITGNNGIQASDHNTPGLIINGNMQMGATLNSKTTDSNVAFGNRILFSSDVTYRDGIVDNNSEMFLRRLNGRIDQSGTNIFDESKLIVNVGHTATTSPNSWLAIGTRQLCITPTELVDNVVGITIGQAQRALQVLSFTATEYVADASVDGDEIADTVAPFEDGLLDEYGPLLFRAVQEEEETEERFCFRRFAIQDGEAETFVDLGIADDAEDVTDANLFRLLVLDADGDKLTDDEQLEIYSYFQDTLKMYQDTRGEFSAVMKSGIFSSGAGESLFSEGRTLLSQYHNDLKPQTIFHIVASANSGTTTDRRLSNRWDNGDDADDGAATANNYVMVIENTAEVTDEMFLSGQGKTALAIQFSSAQARDFNSNFISFIATNNAINSDSVRNTVNVSIGAIEGLSEINTAGVSYASYAADYAEYLRKVNADEQINKGDVVSVVNGQITKDTSLHHQLMVISSTPIIVGAWPGKDEALYEPVAFLGQVFVNVLGVVSKGDYLIPSGQHDGTAIAVSEKDITLEQIPLILGQVWEESNNVEKKHIKTLVGFPFSQWELAKRRKESFHLETTLDELQKSFEEKQIRYEEILDERQELIDELKSKLSMLTQ